MAITTAYEYRLAIREDLLDNYEEISSNPYFEDRLIEISDSWVPVYNGEVIQLWSNEMPSEYDDSWQEFGFSDGMTIVGMMRIDIYNWFSALVRELWDEILEEKEEAN
jgi:hypothetical protein